VALLTGETEFRSISVSSEMEEKLERIYATYMLASKPYGTLYIGVTGNLVSRMEQHRAGTVSGFTAKYKVHQLVWFEWFDDVANAIQCEKTMKHWRRAWKINLIEKNNQQWQDLYPGLIGPVDTNQIKAVPFAK
jgi:putative endonuclease